MTQPDCNLNLKKLEKFTDRESEKDMQSVDPKEIIKKFFGPAAEEMMIMQAIAVSSVKHGCESALELFVSRYGHHFDGRMG